MEESVLQFRLGAGLNVVHIFQKEIFGIKVHHLHFDISVRVSQPSAFFPCRAVHGNS